MFSNSLQNASEVAKQATIESKMKRTSLVFLFFLQIDIDQLFGNISEVWEANLSFWSDYLQPIVGKVKFCFSLHLIKDLPASNA